MGKNPKYEHLASAKRRKTAKYVVWDSFNDVVRSRHRTKAAAEASLAKRRRAFRKRHTKSARFTEKVVKI